MTLRTRWKPGDRFLVRHKDAGVLVVEKKAGVLSQRTDSGKGEDMLYLLNQFLGARGRSIGVLPVHRLDRAVSGLLVYARRPDVQDALIEQFADHSVERVYLAMVDGILEQDRGTFETRLYTDDRSLRVYSLDDSDRREGRWAVTHWSVLERFAGANTTLVEVKLETGIRNQIRVQFAEEGHALLGDRKYGERFEQGPERIFLHAAVLGFYHPLLRENLRFESALPPDLAGWKRSLQRLKKV